MNEVDKRRLDKLDSLLLFVSSSLGLFFTIISGFGEITSFLIPILIMGWAVPIYVGYWRGALTIDLPEERIRGWIYLIVGLLAYSGFTLSYYFLTDSKLLIIGVTSLIILLGFIVAREFSKSMLGIFREEIKKPAKKAFHDTSTVALIAGMAATILPPLEEIIIDLSKVRFEVPPDVGRMLLFLSIPIFLISLVVYLLCKPLIESAHREIDQLKREN